MTKKLIINKFTPEQLAELDRQQAWMDEQREAKARVANPALAKLDEAMAAARAEVEEYERETGRTIRADTPLLSLAEAESIDPSPAAVQSLLRANLSQRLFEKLEKVRAARLKGAITGTNKAAKVQAQTILSTTQDVVKTAKVVDKMARWARGDEVGTISEEDCEGGIEDAAPIGGSHDIDTHLASSMNGMNSGCRRVGGPVDNSDN